MTDCKNHDDCYIKAMNKMNHPSDSHSLYNTRIYDDQNAGQRCHSLFPIDIVEGFGCDWNKLIKYVVIFLLVFLFLSFAKDLFKYKEVYLDVNTTSPYQPSRLTPFQ